MALSGGNLYLDVSGRVDARTHIELSTLPPNIRNLLLQYSMVVNSIHTPCMLDDIIPRMTRYLPGHISQVGYVYEAPGFQRYRQYALPLEEFSDNSGDIDKHEPGFYGLMEHPDNSFTIVFYVRHKVIQFVGNRTRIDPGNQALCTIFSHYRRVVDLLVQNNRPDPHMLAMVGILPGIAIKRRNQLVGCGDIIDMQIQKNLNSGRFICAAVERLMREKGVSQESLVILGSGGTLGSAVAVGFPRALLIDLHNKDTLKNKASLRRIIIDCTTGGSMQEYISSLSRGDIWVNEAFPPPLLPVVQQAKEVGVEVYHIPGVDGKTTPPLPPGYGLTPPCCMGLTDKDIQPSHSVVIEQWDGVNL